VLHRQSDQSLQERLGIGLSQFKILMILQWQPHIAQRQLADCLGQTEASISRQVKLLHEKGMLVTHIDPAERRRHLTTPTAKGIKIIQAAHEVVAQYYAPIFELLNSKEQEQFFAILKRLHTHACAPGKRLACDHLVGIGQLYDSQQGEVS
jgi:DNA-binding MarR family transcriptional regulator